MLVKRASYLKEVDNLKWVCSVFSLGPKICKENDNKLSKPDKTQKREWKREQAIGLTANVWNEVIGKSTEELKFFVKEVGERVAIGEVSRWGAWIVRVWNEWSSEWIGSIHRKKKLGELVGWIKRRLLFLMLVSKKDGETKVQKTFDFI